MWQGYYRPAHYKLGQKCYIRIRNVSSQHEKVKFILKNKIIYFSFNYIKLNLTLKFLHLKTNYQEAICKQPVDMGLSSCTENLERWYYDSREHDFFHEPVVTGQCIYL